MKKIECKINRSGIYDEYRLFFKNPFFLKTISGKDFRKACPALVKGMKRGQTRKLVLTPTKKGIKLERK